MTSDRASRPRSWRGELQRPAPFVMTLDCVETRREMKNKEGDHAHGRGGVFHVKPDSTEWEFGCSVFEGARGALKLRSWWRRAFVRGMFEAKSRSRLGPWNQVRDSGVAKDGRAPASGDRRWGVVSRETGRTDVELGRHASKERRRS